MIVSSRPVVIPVKTKSPNSHRTSTRHVNHKADSIPPSVAALLAITSFTPPPRLRSKALRRFREDEKGASVSPLTSPILSSSPNTLDDALFSEKEPLPLSRSSSSVALETLLSPPDELDESPLALGSPLSARSVSSESVPSLTLDEESGITSWSGPDTPSSSRRTPPPSRLRTFSPPENSDEDHPLLFNNEDIDLSYEVEKFVKTSKVIAETSKDNGLLSKLSFKSNLTASLRVLKSAAKSFSNLSAPMVQPEDFLTRSILSISPQYNTDERRPAYIDLPTPALRRYLNPRTANNSKDVVDVHNCTASIQLQTYRSTFKPSEVNDPFNEMANEPLGRPREVRENRDFLRVIVLEMNMRRQGKLSDSAQGKARFILPPRQASKPRSLGNPARWAPVSYE